jgi:hypothetical protein
MRTVEHLTLPVIRAHISSTYTSMPWRHTKKMNQTFGMRGNPTSANRCASGLRVGAEAKTVPKAVRGRKSADGRSTRGMSTTTRKKNDVAQTLWPLFFLACPHKFLVGLEFWGTYFGMCNIVDVLDEQIQRVDWTLVDPSDPLCFISKGHRKFHDMTGNTVRVECTNKHYSGTRGGPIIWGPKKTGTTRQK